MDINQQHYNPQYDQQQHPFQHHMNTHHYYLPPDIGFDSTGFDMTPSAQFSSSSPVSSTSAVVIPSGSLTECIVSYNTNGGGCKRSFDIEEEYDPSNPSLFVTGSDKCDNLLRMYITKAEYFLKDISVPNGLAMTDKDKKHFSLLYKAVVKPDTNKTLIGFVGGVRHLRSAPFADYNNGHHNHKAKRHRPNGTSSSSNNHNRKSDMSNATTSKDLITKDIPENKMLRDILQRQRDDHHLTYLRSVDPDVFRFINKEINITLVTLIPYFFLLGEQAQHIILTVFEQHIQNPEKYKSFIDLLYYESENKPIGKLLAIYGDAICVVWLLLIKQYQMEIDELFANYRFDIEVNTSDNSGYIGYMQKTKSTLTLYKTKVTSMLENELPQLVGEPNTVRTITNLQQFAFSQICKDIRSLSITRNMIQHMLQCRVYKKVTTSYKVTDDTIHKNFVDDSVAAKLVFDSKEHWNNAAIKRCANTVGRYKDSVCVTESMILSNVDCIKENLLTKNKIPTVGSVYCHEIKFIANKKKRELQYYKVFLKLLQRCGLKAEAKEQQDTILDTIVIM